MFLKLYKNSSVKNILVITLSNIGDVVLTAPVIDILLRDYPLAKLSLVVGAKASSLFESNPRFSQIHIFNRKLNIWQQARWTLGLKQYHYDLVVDLRNSMIGYFLLPKWLTPPVMSANKNIHFKQRHLNRLRSLYDFSKDPVEKLAIVSSKNDELFVDQLLKPFLENGSSFVVIAPKAADSSKTWSAEEFVGLCQAIIDTYGLKIVMIGSKEDKEAIEWINQRLQGKILNLAGSIQLTQLVSLFKRAKMAIVHDSGPMHIASYLNKPLVALFGPTSPVCYGPWSSIFKIVRHNSQCQRCLNPKISSLHNCMSGITQQEVWEAFKEIYEKSK